MSQVNAGLDWWATNLQSRGSSNLANIMLLLVQLATLPLGGSVPEQCVVQQVVTLGVRPLLSKALL